VNDLQQPVYRRHRKRLSLAKNNPAVIIQVFGLLRISKLPRVASAAIKMSAYRQYLTLDQIRLSGGSHPQRNIGFAHRQIELVISQLQATSIFG
jgi:hypothetical protein